MFLKKLISNEKGQSAVIAGIALFMVIAMSALALDIGFVHIQSSREQTAADAAAIAGCVELPITVGNTLEENKVKSVVRDYAVKNGIPDEDILDKDIVLGDVKSSQYTSVRVEFSSEVGFGFARILGFEKGDVTKAAKAQIKPVSAMNDLVPLGVEESVMNTLNVGNTLVVKNEGGEGITGFFGAIDLNGSTGGGANDYTSWLSSGYDGIVEKGDILPVENGNMAGPSWKAFCDRCCTHTPKCTASSYDPQCSSVVTLIVYKVHETNKENNNGNGNKENKENNGAEEKIKSIEVLGFVPFILYEGTKQGEITAMCIQTVIQDGSSLPGAKEFGVYKITLVE
jgi:Flp pilus assembly protein TadG